MMQRSKVYSNACLHVILCVVVKVLFLVLTKKNAKNKCNRYVELVIGSGIAILI